MVYINVKIGVNRKGYTLVEERLNKGILDTATFVVACTDRDKALDLEWRLRKLIVSSGEDADVIGYAF
jgi:hypothetical protein